MSTHTMIAFWLGDDDLPPVTLHYTATEGAAATWDDPADPHEFEITAVTCWSPIAGRFLEIPLSTISDAQFEAWQEKLNEDHDFDPGDPYGDEIDF